MDSGHTILQLALLFLPGIIWAKIDESYVVRKESKQFQLLVKSFLFGTASYAILFVIYSAFDREFEFFNQFLDNKAVITRSFVWEIVWAVVVAFLVSILWVTLATYSVIERFLLKIKAVASFTPRDSDVWDVLLNSDSAATRYLHLRDFEKNLIYTGYLQRYSDRKQLRELYLNDVVIYDLEGNELWSVPNLYLARKPDDIHLEFPYYPE